MTNEEIIELAKHQKWLGNADGWTFNSRQQLIAFARAVQEKTRDECAAVLARVRRDDGDGQHAQWYAGVDGCAAAIRSMTND